MLSKFFRKRPSEGKPLALGGLAAGLAAMDNAWATLDCLGGSVQWNHGRPTIVPPGSGGTQLDHSFLPQRSTTASVWFDVTGGFVLFDGTWEPVEAFTIAEDETDTHWWLEIDDESEAVVITVESGEAWPTAEGLKFIRLFEFGEAGVLSSITRHTTNDVVWGETTFLGLTDTPSIYEGESGKYAKVNEAENALEFSAINYEDIIGAPDPDEPWPGDTPSEEEDCDQNDHPGDDGYNTGTGGDDQDDDDHPGDDDTQGGYGDDDQDDNNHPGFDDCYTTR